MGAVTEMTYGGGFAPPREDIPPEQLAQRTPPRISFAESEPITYGPPAPTQTDRALEVWQVEDRRTYWETVQRLQREYEEQQRQQRALQATERNRQMQLAEGLAGVRGLEEGARQLVEEDRPRAFGFESHQQAIIAATNPRDKDELRRALAYRQSGDGQGLLETIQQNPLYRAARVDVPYADKVAEGLKKIPVVPDPQELVGLPGTSGLRRKIKDTAVDVLVPREVWDTALTLIPAAKARTVGELAAALSIGDADVLRAMKQGGAKLADNELVALGKRLVAEETGAAQIPQLPYKFAKTPQEQRLLDEAARIRGADTAPRIGVEAKLVQAVQKAKRLRPAEEAEQAAARGVRAGRVGEAFQGAEGGFESTRAAGSAAAGRLTEGELQLAADFTRDDADELLRVVARSQRIPETHTFTRLATQRALIKLLGFSREGEQIANRIPTRNEIKMLENIFGPELGKALLDIRGRGAWENVLDLLNLQRVFITAFDFSMPFRQALFLTVPHLKESVPAMAAMVRAGFSDKYARYIDDAMRTDKEFGRYIDAGNFYASPFEEAAKLTDREELFASRMAQKFPGIRRSQQAALTYLNKLQMDVWKTVTKDIGGTPVERRLIEAGREAVPRAATAYQLETDKQLRQMGSVLNHMRGRGDTPRGLADFAPALNWGFFSPRLFISRIQVPLDLFLKSGPARRLVARDIAATAGTGAGLLALGQQLGAWNVELDPRHPDFGKGKIGKTRFDFWGGEQQIFRYTAQMIMQQTASTGAFGKQVKSRPWQDTFLRFLYSKLSPQLGLGVDVLRGETFVGDELKPTKETIKTQAFNRLVPLFIQDVVDATREYGPLGFVGALPAGFGVSVQTYETTGERRRAIVDEIKQSGALTPEERAALDNGVIPNAVRELPEWQEIQQGIEKNSDELRQRNETIAEAGRRLESDEIEAKEYREIVGDARSAYRAIIEALDLPDEGGTIADYFAKTYDRATENGILDQDKLDQYITEWESSATPEQQSAIRELELAADDPMERQYRAARVTLAEGGYFERRDAAFDGFKKRIPATSPFRQTADSEWGTVNDFIDWVKADTLQRGVAVQKYDTHPAYNAFEDYYTDASGDFLVTNPLLDALAVEWGYQTRVHSAEAARLYEERTGQPAPIPAP